MTEATRPQAEQLVVSPWTNHFGSFWVPRDDLIVNNEFVTKSGWEMETVFFLRDRVFKGGQGTLIDVGAHFGLVSLPIALAHPGVTVHCFEPSPVNYQVLRYNIEAHKLEERVKSYMTAVGDTSGMAEIMWATDNSVDHRIVRGDEGKVPGIWDEAQRKHGQVPILTLAEALPWQSLARPIVLKVDVQGSECAVLRGLKEHQPDVLVIEVWPYGLLRAGETQEALTRLLCKYSHGALLTNRFNVLGRNLHLNLLGMLPWGAELEGISIGTVGFDMVCAMQEVPL